MFKSVASVFKVNIPEGFPFDWAGDWGEDEYGLWAAFTYKKVRLAFRWIPPGNFQMGSPEDEPERDDDENRHEVQLSKGFWMAETTCTQALWQAVMGDNPSHFKGSRRPVEQVSWHDCQEFIVKLNEVHPDLNLRLPTEAEWEYTCRAGTTTPFSFGDQITSEQVNYNSDFPYNNGPKEKPRNETVDVKSLSANNWGLYETHGNVFEWCSDWYGEYSPDPVKDPQGLSSGKDRVLRGGCWFSDGQWVRSASRSGNEPDFRNVSFGFRLARGQKGKEENRGK